MSNKNFKDTGIPSFVSKKTIYEQDIGSLTTMISAASSKHSIVVTDIIASKASSGNVLFYDGADVCLRVGFSTNGDTIWSHAFSTPLKLSKGNAFKIKSNTSDIDLCVTVCYYEAYESDV